MSSIFLCGFECGRLGTGEEHWTAAGGSIDTAVKRSGGRSLKSTFAASSGYSLDGITHLTEILVARFYILFETLPDADVVLAGRGDGTGLIGLGFTQSTGTLHCAVDAGAVMAGAGLAIDPDVWYRVDLRMDTTVGAKVCDARITDEAGTTTVLTQATSTSLNGLGNRFKLGSNASCTGTWYYDDVKLSETSGDYPLGAGTVEAFIPTSDGTHNISGANQFERGTTGTDITNATTDAHELVDEIPLDDATPDTDDFIAAIAPANASDYVELVFGYLPGEAWPATGPITAEVILAYHAAATGSGNIRIALNDNGTIDDVLNQTAAGVTTVQYARKHYAAAPSGGAWTVSPGNGDFTDLRARFYSSDANPDQYLDGIMIEAEFSGDPIPDPGGYYACAGTLPTFITADQDKIDALRALRAAGTPIGQAFELVKVEWPSPDGTIYYATTKTDEVAAVAPPVSPIDCRLIPESLPDSFVPVQMDSAIGDEEVDLEFWDGDEEFSQLLVDHGEGIRTTLYYWFPEVELLLPVWHGHLRQEDAADVDRVKVKAAQGFRSSDALLPRRAHWRECQAIFGGVLDTQAEIDENDCPYNKHIGGAVGNFESGSTPYTSCPRRTRDDCEARLGNDGNYMLSHATQEATVANNQTKGDRLYSTTAGNETNLKDPVPVVMGTRRIHGMPVLNFRNDENNNDPDHGWFRAQYEACEGPVDSISFARITVGSDTQDAVPLHYNYRLGEQGQTPVQAAMTEHNYSSLALILYVFGWVNPADVDPSNASASVVVRGLNNIRVYTDAETYADAYTDNRAWHLMEMLTNKRWGYGYDHDRLDIPSFIEAACWCANVVRFTDDNGDTHDHIRSLSHVELRGRKVQEQIDDMCLAGRLSRPFLFNGKIHIVPLRAMTSAELAVAPVFTDSFAAGSPNIVWQDGKSSLKISRTSDIKLPNRIECTFDDADNDYLEQPCRPVEDIDAQLAAGRVVGDHSRKINIKKYGLAGVVVEGQAIKMSTALRDLGPHDEGGIVNNLRLKFKIWFLDSLDLFPTKVIKVESSRLTKYGFEYFRVMTIERQADLTVEIEAQAYNDTYMDAFEELYGGIDPIPTDPPDPDSGSVAAPVDPLVYTSVSYSSGTLTILSEAS